MIREDFKESWNGWMDRVMDGVFGLLLAALFAGGGVLVALGAGAVISAVDPASTYCAVTDTPLTALADTPALSGHFFLGTGQVGTDLTFFYLTQQGGYFSAHSATKNVRVFQDDPKAPYVETGDTQIAGAWGFVAFPVGTCTTDFHIPTGSVESNYKVNA